MSKVKLGTRELLTTQLYVEGDSGNGAPGRTGTAAPSVAARGCVSANSSSVTPESGSASAGCSAPHWISVGNVP